LRACFGVLRDLFHVVEGREILLVSMVQMGFMDDVIVFFRGGLSFFLFREALARVVDGVFANTRCTDETYIYN
jgi:hypothetical protein